MAFAAKLYTDSRSSQRHRVERDGTLRGSDRLPVDVQLEDLSTTGCQLAASIELTPGEFITIGIAGLGMQPAQVVRQVGDAYGCEFITALTEPELTRALREPEISVSAFPLGNADMTTTADGYRLPMVLRLFVIGAGTIAGWAAITLVTRLLIGMVR